MIRKLALIATLAASVASSRAVTVNYGAAQFNGFGDTSGAGLSGVWMEVGTYAVGDVSSFTLLDGGNLDNFGAGLAGVGNPIATGNLTMLANLRLAIRVFDSADNTGNVIHFVSSSLDSWKTIAGDGSPTDLGSLTIDLADLTNGTNALLPSAIVEVGAGIAISSADNGLGGKNFAAIPEPSASLAALLGLGTLALRRRRA